MYWIKHSTVSILFFSMIFFSVSTYKCYFVSILDVDFTSCEWNHPTISVHRNLFHIRLSLLCSFFYTFVCFIIGWAQFLEFFFLHSLSSLFFYFFFYISFCFSILGQNSAREWKKRMCASFFGTHWHRRMICVMLELGMWLL